MRSSWIRAGQNSGMIRCAVDIDGIPAYSELAFKRENYGETLTARRADDLFKEFVWTQPPLVAGYGATRGPFASRTSSHSYSVRDSTATLFDAEAQLQNPELSIRRQLSAGRDAQQLLRQLDRILLLPPNSTQLTSDGFVITGHWSGGVGLAGLSDGYRSTLTWIIDLLGWSMTHAELSNGPPLAERTLQGIVLIDELEQHLHPTWQRQIIRQLREQFPDLQFIVTTHAPLCVVGTTDLQDSEVALCVVRNAEDNVTLTSGITPPRRQRADQIVTSFLFGLDSSSAPWPK